MDSWNVTFRENIVNKDTKTKHQRAMELYPSYMSWDVALPVDWVAWVCEKTGADREMVVSSFVWLYFGNQYSGPAPLSLWACDLMDMWEL